MQVDDYAEYFSLQKEMATKVIRENRLGEKVNIIAGADVAYDEARQQMIGAIVCLDPETHAIIDFATHTMEITFPYVPGLFSFREIPALLIAYEKLKQKPDLIICDGQGIAHPKRVGMASHLGLELNVPTIGCAKKRLTGAFDSSTLDTERGAIQHLNLDGEIIGAALRTQADVKPVFVSIGHLVDLPSVIKWVLQLAPKYRLPETTRAADRLVNELLKK